MNYYFNFSIFRKKYTHILINSLIVWLFLFDISFKNTTTLISSRKLILLIFGIYFLKKQSFNVLKIFQKLRIYVKELKSLFLIVIISTLWCTFILYLNNNNISGNAYAINRLLYLLVTVICGSFFLLNRFISVQDFIDSLIGAITVEGITAILQLLFVPVKILYDNIFYQSGNLSYLTYHRAVGIACEGALLSLYLSIAFILCLYNIYIKKTSLIYKFLAIFLLFVNFFVGKTGIIISTVSLLLFILVLFKKKRIHFFDKKVIIIFFFFIVCMFLLLHSKNPWISNAFSRTIQIFTKGINDESIQDLIQMFKNTQIPINILLLGSGITFGKTATGIVFYNDSGYIKSIFGYGLPLAFCFYFIVYKNLLNKVNQMDDTVLNKVLKYLILIFLIIEIKEPFLLKGPLIFIIIIIYFLNQKEECKSYNDNHLMIDKKEILK